MLSGSHLINIVSSGKVILIGFFKNVILLLTFKQLTFLFTSCNAKQVKHWCTETRRLKFVSRQIIQCNLHVLHITIYTMLAKSVLWIEKKKCLPGHTAVPQVCTSLSFPVQLTPLYWGSGLSHNLFRVWEAPPQVTGQLDQPIQLLQPPLTILHNLTFIRHECFNREVT